MELPRELRQLEQMRRERQEWAADHYPVTEQGLLARFNPRTESPSQTGAPAAEEHGQTPADSFEPTDVDSPPTQVDPPESPPGVTNVLSPDPAAQAPGPATSLLSLGVGRGRTEALMDTLGRGRPPFIPALPPIGRGFLLQIPQDQIPTESMMSPGRMRTAPLCPVMPKDTYGEHLTPEPFSSSLMQSLRSFRY